MQALETFDAVRPGALSEHTIVGGVLSAAPGHAEIIQGHSRSGKNSLKLNGGTDRTVEWRFSQPFAAEMQLAAWAERWTRVAPFAFRIECWKEGKWQLLSNHPQIAVGGFHTKVESSVPAGSSRVRFVCTSKAGVMLDDLQLIASEPMKLLGVDPLTPVVPLMIRMSAQPAVGFTLRTSGNLQPLALEEIGFSFSAASRWQDIEEIKILAGSRQPEDPKMVTLATLTSVTQKGTVALTQKIAAGESCYWLAIKLREGASIDRRIQVNIDHLTIAGKRQDLNVKSPLMRCGVAVRKRGDSQSTAYRIPGLARSKKGTLCAVYDIRYKHAGDLPADIDVGLSRSFDGGQTWQPMQVIIDMGNDPAFGFDGVGDPAILCDEKTGRLWVAALWSHGNRGWHGSAPGLTPEQTGQLVLVHSDDDGATWSKPENITAAVKQPEWRLLLNGPGAGICQEDGTLVFAAQFRSADGGDTQGKPFSTIISSKDQGKTWQIGSGGKIDTTEAQVAALADGRLLLNCRDNRGGTRTVLVTDDRGKTWTPHATDRKALREPVCMASLLRWGHTKQHFFSNPDSTSARSHMTIKSSADEGMTWPLSSQLLYDERSGYGYSCLAPVDDRHIGVLYEGAGDLFYLKIPIAEVTQP